MFRFEQMKQGLGFKIPFYYYSYFFWPVFDTEQVLYLLLAEKNLNQQKIE